MKKKLNSKNALKLVAATSMTIFSLLSVFSATAAWFDSQRNLNEGATSFGVASGSTINLVSCYALRYDGANGATASDVSSSSFSISMPEYDSILTDRNTHTPVFFRIEISGYSTSKHLTITVPCTRGYMDDDDHILSYVSNVACVRFFTGLYDSNSNLTKDEYDPSDPGDVPDLYDAIHQRALATPASRFVVDNAKSYSLTLRINSSALYASNLVHEGNPDTVVVYLAFDYHATNTADFVNSWETLQQYQLDSDIGVMTLDEVNPS